MIGPIPAKIRVLSLIERAQEVDARLPAAISPNHATLLICQRVPNR
jgi:hypothetical protein